MGKPKVRFEERILRISEVFPDPGSASRHGALWAALSGLPRSAGLRRPLALPLTTQGLCTCCLLFLPDRGGASLAPSLHARLWSNIPPPAGLLQELDPKKYPGHSRLHLCSASPETHAFLILGGHTLVLQLCSFCQPLSPRGWTGSSSGWLTALTPVPKVLASAGTHRRRVNDESVGDGSGETRLDARHPFRG